MKKTTLIFTVAAILAGGLVYGTTQHNRHAGPSDPHEQAATGHPHDTEVSEHGSGMMACPRMHGDAAASMDEMHEHMEEMTKHMAAMREACGMDGPHTEDEAGHADEETPSQAGENHSHDH